MKTLGIQINSGTAILVVLEQNQEGEIVQCRESTKFELEDSLKSEQVRHFKDQVDSTIDTINPDYIGIIARNKSGKSKMGVSPLSFKLEGIFQLYEKKDIEFIWPQTLTPFIRQNQIDTRPKFTYQTDAFNLAHFLLIKYNYGN